MLSRNATAVAIAIMLATMGACGGTSSNQNTSDTNAGTEPQDNDRPNLGRVMWSAFACAAYAELSGDEREQKRLFDIGYNAGTTFLASIKNQTIPETERPETPVGVLLRLAGPSNDFMIGRIFESAMADAFDDVVKEDNNGLPLLNPTDWADGELKVTRAKNKYQSSNCALIQ